METRELDEDRSKNIIIKKGKDGKVDAVDANIPQEDLQEDALQASLENTEEVEPDEEVVFDFPKLEEDDEELTDLSPEEAEKVLREKAKEQEKLHQQAKKLKDAGNRAMEKGEYLLAKENFKKLRDLYPKDLESALSYLSACTKNFDDLEDYDAFRQELRSCFDVDKEVLFFAIKEQHQEKIEKEIERCSEKEKNDSIQYEEKKAQRKEKFLSRWHRQNKILLAWAIPALLCMVASIVLFCNMNSLPTQILAVLAIVFAVLFVLLLVPTLFFFNKSVNAFRLLQENKKKESTQEGRDLIHLQEKIHLLKRILQSNN